MRSRFARGSAVVTYRAKREGKVVVATASTDVGAADATRARVAAAKEDRVGLITGD